MGDECRYQPIAGLPFLNIQQYTLQSVIEHNKSPIYHCKDNRGRNYALKDFSITQIHPDDLKKHLHVMKLLVECKKDNVAEYISMCVKEEVVCGQRHRSILLLMEYCQKNLCQHVRDLKDSDQRLGLDEIMDFVRQMVHILAYFEGVGISQRDIKPENIMVSKETTRVIYKLVDFDEAIVIGINHTEPLPITTLQFSSYALVRQLQTTQKKVFDPFKLDTFALGLTLLFLCSLGRLNLRERTSHFDNRDSHENYIKQNRRKWLKQYRNEEELGFLLKLMLEIDEFKRDDFLTLKIKIESFEEETFDRSEGSESSSTTASFKLRGKKISNMMHAAALRQRKLLLLLLLLQLPFFVFFCIC